LRHRRAQIGGHDRRLEQDEQTFRAPGEGRQAMEAIADPRRFWCRTRGPSRWQIDHEEVDRPTAQQGAGDRQALVQIGRGDHDEPLEAHAAGNRLDRIEAAGEVQPGHDRAGCLGLGHGSQGERRLATRSVTT
jgi:hypothetical protein